MRALTTLVFVALLVGSSGIAGVAAGAPTDAVGATAPDATSLAPAGDAAPTERAPAPDRVPTEGAPTTDAGSSGSAADDCSPVATGDEAPNPDSDVIGWENGCWYNATLDVDQSDGLSETELQAIISRAMARVEYLRQLEFKSDVPVSVKSREQLQQETANRSVNETVRTFDNAKFEALFMINESTDSIAVQNENRGSSVLGYYSPTESSIVLVAESRSQVTISEATLGHELVHALQDQHFNLSDPRYFTGTRDEINAKNGLIEGDASYVEYLYVQNRCKREGHPWNGTCVEPASGSSAGELANFGPYLMKFQPYSDGPNFVATVKRQGGWDAVNAVYDDLPESAEQVIHPEKYETEPPVEVALDDETADGWERVRPPGRPDYAEVGQSGVAAMLVYPLYDSSGRTQIVSARTWLNYTDGNQISSFDPLNYGFDAAAGWAGDRMHVYENQNGETAYVWRLVWDSPEDAKEFLAAYEQVLSYRGASEAGANTYVIEDGGFADAFHVVRDGDTVTIVNAPTTGQLADVRTSLSVDGGGDGDGTPTPTTDGTPMDTAMGSADDDESTATDDTPSSTPGMTPIAALVALAAAALLARRRR